MLFGFEGAILQDGSGGDGEVETPDTYRTQKLSTSSAKIVGPAPAKIACRRVLFLCFFNDLFDTFLFLKELDKKLFCFFNNEYVKIFRVSEV